MLLLIKSVKPCFQFFLSIQKKQIIKMTKCNKITDADKMQQWLIWIPLPRGRADQLHKFVKTLCVYL